MKRSGMPARRTGPARGGPIRRRPRRPAARACRGGGPVAVMVLDQAQIDAVVAQVRAGLVSAGLAARETGLDAGDLDTWALRAARAAAALRDNGLCVFCGAPAVDVQHRHARGSGGTGNARVAYGLANLICLCRSCHRDAEDRTEETRLAGLWLRSGLDQDPRAVPVRYRRGTSAELVWLTDDGDLLDHNPLDPDITPED
jgi:hypothetical protein